MSVFQGSFFFQSNNIIMGAKIFYAALLFVIGLGGVNCTYGVNEIGLGFNNTIDYVAQEGHSTIILADLELPNSRVTGYYVWLAEDNCAIRFEIWQRISRIEYTLLKYFDYQGPKGYYEINLPEVDRFEITSNQRIGFSSLRPSSTCVGYKYVAGSTKRTQTMRYMFENTAPPSVGQTYSFIPYQTTFLFPIGVVVLNPIITSTIPTTTTTTPPPPPATTTTVTTSTSRRYGVFVGYNYTTNQPDQYGYTSIIHHGLDLRDGTVLGFRFRNAKSGCHVRLQIWRKISEVLGLYDYSLIYQKSYSGSSTGLIYMPIPPSEYFDIMSTDKLGFTTEDQGDSCIPFYYVQTTLRSQTIQYTGTVPNLYNTISFIPYQTTYLFAIEVELEGLATVGATGPMGFKGIRGQNGDRGEKGERGFKGNLGSLGQSGDKGERGFDGAKGPYGSIGLRGADGPSGRDGTSGLTGEKGQKGDTGDRGFTGERGLDGSRGDYGPRGPVGRTGTTGARGDALKGVDGETGLVGPIGATGSTGIRGDRGLGGASGEQGVMGPVGSTGVRGPMWSPDKEDYCMKKNIFCEHHCINTDLDAKCGCRTGYQLYDNSKCLEVDECMKANGRCTYDCINTPGSYYCACPLGLKLANDSHKCNDIDECSTGKASCKSKQTCINLWNDFYCAGPFEKDASSNSGPSSSAQIGDANIKLVTRDVIIGLMLWMILLSILDIMIVIMMIPDCQDYCSRKPRYPASATRRPQFYYPAFFPRVSLDRRPSSDRIDIIEARQSRNDQLDRNESDGIVNEAHIHDGQQRSEL